MERVPPQRGHLPRSAGYDRRGDGLDAGRRAEERHTEGEHAPVVGDEPVARTAGVGEQLDDLPVERAMLAAAYLAVTLVQISNAAEAGKQALLSAEREMADHDLQDARYQVARAQRAYADVDTALARIGPFRVIAKQGPTGSSPGARRRVQRCR